MAAKFPVAPNFPLLLAMNSGVPRYVKLLDPAVELHVFAAAL